MVRVIASSRYKIDRKLIKKTVSDILIEHGLNQNHAVNVIFAGRTKLKQLSKNYKNENEALPVLTFVYNENSDNQNYLGEVFICYPQAVLLAARRNKTVDNVIMDLVKHGLNNIFKNL